MEKKEWMTMSWYILLELDDVNLVQLRPDNTGNRLNDIDLERKFTGDYSYVTR